MRDYHDEIWQAFVKSVNPVIAETERFGMPGSDERPGSPADIRMRAAHENEVVAFKFRMAPPLATLSRLATQEVVDEWRFHKDPPKYKQSTLGANRPRQTPTAARAAEKRSA